jgi:hypothetical protein
MEPAGDLRNDRPIYLDHHATTPVDPRVVEAMMPYLTNEFGNPSSSHAYGRTAAKAVETARAQVASLLGASPGEIVFTSSGTESNPPRPDRCRPRAACRRAGRPHRHHHHRAPRHDGHL